MSAHLVSIRNYAVVFAALIVLLAVTVLAAYLPLGLFSTLAAMTIATLKAVLIALYFMHLRYSTRLTWLFAGAALVWLVIMISLTLSDEMTRGWMPGA